MSLKKQGVFNSSKNPAAKKINICNSIGEIMFETYGNFEAICRDNNLPFAALTRSLHNNSEPIYKSSISKNRANNADKFIYIGWFAKIV